MVLVDSSRSLVNNGFVQILLEVSRYYLYLIFFSKSLKDDCICPLFSMGSSLSNPLIFLHLEYIYPRYIPCMKFLAPFSNKFFENLSLNFPLSINSFCQFIFSFIALNKNEKKQIQNIFPRNRIIIIGNGVEYDEKRNAKLESYFQDKSLRKDIKIGFLGRFDVYIKGLDILLNAYSEYQRSTNNINIRLSLLGEHRVREYDSREFIERIRRDLPYPELLEVAGPFYGNSKWTELAKLDLLIQPSRTEGMPNTVLEAMSAGVPCAVTPNTNVGDLIIKAQAGWVVRATSKDFLDFFHSLESCSKNELLQLGGNAKKYAKENLTWDKIGKLKYFN